MVAGVPERHEAANVVGVTDRSLVCSLSTCGSGATLSAASKQVLTCACTVLKGTFLLQMGQSAVRSALTSTCSDADLERVVW